jgi:uncharacterized membrane protein YozB (DUF420 family)
MLADLTLLAYVVLIVPTMLIGFYFARRKLFDTHHKPIMTAIMLVNWVLIGFLMVASYAQGVLPNLPSRLSDPVYVLPTLHLIIGGAAQIVATYLVIRMWFERQLPDWFKVANIKGYMRFTLAGWLIAALLGVGIYLTWYAARPVVAIDDLASPTPPLTSEPAVQATPDVTPELTPEPAGG